MDFNVSVVSKRIDVRAHNARNGATTVGAIKNAIHNSTLLVGDHHDLHYTFQVYRNASAGHGQKNGSRLSGVRSPHQKGQAHIASHRAGSDSCQERLFEPQISYQGMDTLAGVLDRPAGDAATCCRACVSSPPCTHWTWFENGCSLKHGKLAPIKLQWAPDVISGLMPLDIRIERLWVSPNVDMPRLPFLCFWDEEDIPLFNTDPPPRYIRVSSCPC